MLICYIAPGRSLTTCMTFDAKSRGLVIINQCPIAQGRYSMAILQLKKITENTMHSKTLIEPPLAAVPVSLKLSPFINYKEVPCYGPSQLPTKVTRIGSEGRRSCQSCQSRINTESKNLQPRWLTLISIALVTAILQTRLSKAS